MSASEMANKAWYCAQVLRDDGLGCGYVEQITFLIFLKMADEREESRQQAAVPTKYNWSKLVKLDVDALAIQYRHTLETLRKTSSMLGAIFPKVHKKYPGSFSCA